MMQTRYIGRLASGIRVPRRKLGVIVSPALAQASSLMRGKRLSLLVDLVFLFSPLAGATLCSPDHPATTPTTTRNNLIWRNWADTNFKSAHSTVIRQTSQPQTHWESGKVRERSSERERFTPIKTSQGSVTVSQKEQYVRQAEHQGSDKFASTKGCFSICLQQRIQKPPMPSLKRKRNFIKFLCKT